MGRHVRILCGKKYRASAAPQYNVSTDEDSTSETSHENTAENIDDAIAMDMMENVDMMENDQSENMEIEDYESSTSDAEEIPNGYAADDDCLVDEDSTNTVLCTDVSPPEAVIFNGILWSYKTEEEKIKQRDRVGQLVEWKTTDFFEKRRSEFKSTNGNERFNKIYNAVNTKLNGEPE